MSSGDPRSAAIARELATILHVSHRTVLGWEADGLSLEAISASLASAEGDHDPTWLSIASIAARFEVDAKTVRRWVSSGQVDARRFGPKLLRISVASVLRFSRPLIREGRGLGGQRKPTRGPSEIGSTGNASPRVRTGFRTGGPRPSDRCSVTPRETSTNLSMPLMKVQQIKATALIARRVARK